MLALPIQRITPTASPITTTAVAGKVAANGALECGVRDSIVFRSPAPSGLTARRYYWRFTNNTAGYKFVRANGVLKDTAITTTDSVKVLVTPNQTASIGVKAEINYGNGVFEETNEATLTTKINTVTPTLTATIDRNELCATENQLANVSLNATGGKIVSYTTTHDNNGRDAIVTVAPSTDKPNTFLISPKVGANGTATIEFVVANACGRTATQTVKVYVATSAPAALGGLQTDYRTTFCPNRDKLFWIDSIPNAVRHEWQPISKGIVIDADGTRAYILVQDYTIQRFAITAYNGCGATTRTYNVAAGRGTSPCMLGNSTPPTETVVLYPNPANQTLQVRLPQLYSDDLTISIHNSMGIIQKNIKVSPNNTTPDGTVNIDVSTLPEGLYVVRLQDVSTAEQYNLMISR